MSRAFFDFFYELRARRVSATTHNWLALLEALQANLHGSSLDGFYWTARCLLCSDETQYDGFDQAFDQTFRGKLLDDWELLRDEISQWLQSPKALEDWQRELAKSLESMDIAKLKEELEKRLREQKERHDGGGYWIGTGGRSPFGHGGVHPSGVRIGGEGGGRSALAVAQERRFRAYRRDVVLDTRQMSAALRKLRELARDGSAQELDIIGTIDATARAGGELEVRLHPPRENRVRVLLLMDVGGSMDAHAEIVSQLFSAAWHNGDFREVRPYYFHNCIYSHVYEDPEFSRPVSIDEIVRTTSQEWHVIVAGDAWMHPGELLAGSGNFWDRQDGKNGLQWLATIADRFPRSAWLNPEPQRVWTSASIAQVAEIFAMYPMTVDGLQSMIQEIKRPTSGQRRRHLDRLLGRH